MGINMKRKRYLKFNGVQFLWYVKAGDYDEDCIHIISEDKELYFKYRFNQIVDKFTHPRIFVEKSEKLKRGIYNFFPLLTDEIASSYTVSQILKWYYSRDPNLKPIDRREDK